jgi:4'-phosphopantetheinyl transferase
MEVFAMDISVEAMAESYEQMLCCVSDEKRNRVQRFFRKEDALRGLGGEVLVRWLACSRLCVGNDQLSFARSQHGKPFLGGYPELQFNVSHAGKWVLCAMDAEPLGVDIEEIRPIDLEVGRICFSEQEFAELMQRPEKERLNHFYELWTLKESFAKADGRGLNLPLKKVTFSAGQAGGVIHTDGWDSPYRYYKQYSIEAGYKAAVAASHERFPDTVHFISCTDIQLSSLKAEREQS